MLGPVAARLAAAVLGAPLAAQRGMTLAVGASAGVLAAVRPAYRAARMDVLSAIFTE